MEKQPVRPHFEEKASMEDEIDLFELWNGLVEEKLTVFLFFLIVIALGAIYAFSVTPVYKSEAYLLPPEVSDIQEINRLHASFGVGSAYSEKAIFEAYKENLLSRTSLLTFFRKQNLIKLYEPNDKNQEKEQLDKTLNDAFSDFVENVKINSPRKNSGFLEITMSLPDESDVRKFLKEYLQKVSTETRKQIKADVIAQKQFLMEQLLNEMRITKQTAQKKREDKIVRLTESINIARKLNIKDPLKAGPAVNIQGVNNQGLPLYYLGYHVLEAEKTALEARKSDDAFTEQLRKLEERYRLLNSVDINENLFKVVKVDQSPSLGEKVKPKKALILAVSGVLGLMLGVFIAFIRRAIKNRQATLAAS
ncbi:lipopolysaccharide biosynthesis protein [Hydrogenovibrio crunogenus]|uniref:Lipopolysaccharide biosynthesis protein n=1 Tax=Hydrogenovibrio crunogenus TaxID=39765 RepID=A0A4P7P0N8_9GAMM|nr:Wzz/FepE/Etk N-terminal domain-containing protein [Hydrogenovibrio crunogenus]QBZ83700.1 lipopolysaccharide biosynthesis protein [Hydrogenovibrio crunogenus]